MDNFKGGFKSGFRMSPIRMSANSRPNQKLDCSKFVARFGCGVIFWYSISARRWRDRLSDNSCWFVAVAVIFAIACGLLSVLFGDQFWTNLGKWIP